MSSGLNAHERRTAALQSSQGSAQTVGGARFQDAIHDLDTERGSANNFDLDTHKLGQARGAGNRVQSAAGRLIKKNYNEQTGYGGGIGGANINMETFVANGGTLKDEHNRLMIILDPH